MKVVVYHEEQQKKEYYARIVHAVATKLTVPCEIHSFSTLSAAKALQQDPDAFDVYLLEGSVNGLKLALQVRAQTYRPAIIFLSLTAMTLPDFLCSRPSGIQRADSPKDVVLALKYSFLEHGRHKYHMIIRSKEAVYRLPFKDITYLESCQRLILVHAGQRQLQFYGKLADVLSSLPTDLFIRCHQSYAVNLENVASLNKAQHYFTLSNGDHVDISKAYYCAVAEQFEAFISRS